jgi:hypothetical protein
MTFNKMKNFEPFDNRSYFSASETERHKDKENQESSSSQNPQLLLYLIPVIGFFPSLWTLYRRQGTREQLTVSRLSITLVFFWLLGYLLLASGAVSLEFFALRLLILNTFLTSGYFLVSIWLIVRTLKGTSPSLPGLSRIAEQWLSKYLS